MKRLFFLLISANAFLFAFAQPQVVFQQLTSGLSEPVDIVSPNDNSKRLFIVELSGKIKIWNGNTVLAQPFLDMSTVIGLGGERGLLSIAFHPDFINSGFFFVYYNDPVGAITLARYRIKTGSPNEADPASAVILLSIPKALYANHNGGKLNFGQDGYLYIGTGDGGGGGDPFKYAQNNKSYFGKLLRIDVNTTNTPPYYSIPATNPFKNSPDFLNEIVASGLRNPWRWSFDRQTGDMWLTDVGQVLWEEVNMRPKDSILNGNYGWSCFEGMHPYDSACGTQPNTVFPVFEYPHNFNDGGFAITGGYVYRGTEYPSLQGYYICADWGSGNGWLLNAKPSGGWNSYLIKTWPHDIVTFGEDQTGTIYAASLGAGIIYKITVANAIATAKLLDFSVTNKGQIHQLNWRIDNVDKSDVYIIERSVSNNTSFSELGRVLPDASTASRAFSFNAKISSNTDYYYRLKIFTASGSNYYSETIKVPANTNSSIKAWVVDNTINIFATENLKTIVLTDALGRIVFRKKIPDPRTADFVSISALSKGIIFCSVETMSGNSRLFKFIH
jgi:glucose/arabinose dehydrogenase